MGNGQLPRLLCRQVALCYVFLMWSCQAKLIIFGDSWSDGGSDIGILPASVLVQEQLSTGEVDVGPYPAPPYWRSRFSNGINWVDWLATTTGQQADNFACGGSGSRTGHLDVLPPFGYLKKPVTITTRSLLDQAHIYVDLHGGKIDESNFILIFIGPDEYLRHAHNISAASRPSDVVAAINETISITHAAGVRKFVVFNLPPISAFPFAASLDKGSIDGLVKDHNSRLADLIGEFNGSDIYPNATIYLHDIHETFTAILADPGNAHWLPGFHNWTAPCYGSGGELSANQAAGFGKGVCPDPDFWVFWDSVHPTKHMNYLIFLGIVQQLGPELAVTATPNGACPGCPPSVNV